MNPQSQDPKPFNNLTPAQAERLAILAEECAEVIQMIGKVLRHGYESYHPRDALKRTNRYMLAVEIGHVAAATSMMLTSEDVQTRTVAVSKDDKLEAVRQYTHHQ